jgi:excisionase family DNA binding protein
MSDRTEADITGTTGRPGQTGSPGRSGHPAMSARAAADALGINERTVRRWLDEGRLRAPKVRGAYRIEVAEVERARLVLLGEDERGNAVVEAPRPDTGHDRTTRADRAAAPAMLSVPARTQLDLIRDEWLQPLIAQIREQAEAMGRLEERLVATKQERDRLAAQLSTDRSLTDLLVEALQHDRDTALREAETLRQEIASLRAIQDPRRGATTGQDEAETEQLGRDTSPPNAPQKAIQRVWSRFRRRA